MRKRRLSAATLLLALGIAALVPGVGSCSQDPVHDQDVANLGPETPGVPEGPYHRAGQPCTTCHGGEGPATTQFSMAGTIFDADDSTVGANGVEVLLVDSLGSSPAGSVTTNCVGNFYISPTSWSPAFPVLVGLQSGNTKATMATQISRATSCAQCHSDPPSLSTVGHVYINVSPNPDEERQCPVSPVAGGGDGGGL